MVATTPTSPHSLATASGLLLGTLGASMAVGALVGWALGGAGLGLLVGAVVGIPLAVLRGLPRLLQGRVREDLFTNPRPVPGRLAPMLAGTALIVLALPIFAIAGFPLKGWALAAVLWAAAQTLGYLLTRLPLDAGNLAASGVRGIGMGFRAFIVGIPLVAVTVADSRVGVAAVVLYALAYTLELAVSLITFFGAEAKA